MQLHVFSSSLPVNGPLGWLDDLKRDIILTFCSLNCAKNRLLVTTYLSLVVEEINIGCCIDLELTSLK